MRLSVFAVVLSTAAAVPAVVGAMITSDISTPKIAGKCPAAKAGAHGAAFPGV